MKKKLAALGIIFLIVILGSVIVANIFIHKKGEEEKNVNLKIVSSFYPMYIITLNLTDGIDNISVENLTPNQTGCLHDYQFSTSDMKQLENADILVINGGGMESFITDVAKQYPKLDVVDSSEGISFLAEDADEVNAHAWLNTSDYIIQVENVRDSLMKLDPDNAKAYKTNADKYISSIEAISQRIKSITIDSYEGVLIFHDAFAYLADEMGLNVAYSIEIEGDNSALSAGEIAEIIDNMKENDIKYIFVEQQYSTSIADSIAKATGATVYVIDSIVTGDDDKDAYINAMNSNIDIIQSVMGK